MFYPILQPNHSFRENCFDINYFLPSPKGFNGPKGGSDGNGGIPSIGLNPGRGGSGGSEPRSPKPESGKPDRGLKSPNPIGRIASRDSE